MRLFRLPGVFQPHSDSWSLAEHLAREPLPRDARVLDLCSGSGVLAITAAQRPETKLVLAVDVSRRATTSIALNARLNGVKVKTVRGDLFAAVGGERFDLIVSNPPYLPGPEGAVRRRRAARAWEAGASGRAFIDRICSEAGRHLNPGGRMLLIHSSVCGEAQTLALLAEHGMSAQVVGRNRGPLGPRLSARAGWLLERGLIGADRMEEMLVIRAEHLPHPPLRAAVEPSTSARTSDGVRRSPGRLRR